MWTVNCEFPIFISCKCFQFFDLVGLNISWYWIPLNEICVDQACEFFSFMIAKWKYNLTIFCFQVCIIKSLVFYQINFLIILDLFWFCTLCSLPKYQPYQHNSPVWPGFDLKFFIPKIIYIVFMNIIIWPQLLFLTMTKSWKTTSERPNDFFWCNL